MYCDNEVSSLSLSPPLSLSPSFPSPLSFFSLSLISLPPACVAKHDGSSTGSTCHSLDYALYMSYMYIIHVYLFLSQQQGHGRGHSSVSA